MGSLVSCPYSNNLAVEQQPPRFRLSFMHLTRCIHFCGFLRLADRLKLRSVRRWIHGVGPRMLALAEARWGCIRHGVNSLVSIVHRATDTLATASGGYVILAGKPFIDADIVASKYM